MATARVAIRDWDQIFCNWSKPSSDTEAEKQGNAERMIRDAIKEYAPFNNRSIEIIPQGSYRNNTNVRQESDVDICVRCPDTFFYDLDFADYTREEAAIPPAVYTYAQFKSEVQAALEKKFGKAGVKRGDKAFDVHANTYRVYADVVATFPYRMYTKKVPNAFLSGYETAHVQPTGTGFITDGGLLIQNWPEQHYSNGVEKNKRTGKRFKAVVRGLKNLRCEMEDRGVAEARPISSYLIECLAYNVPDILFTGDSYYFDARQCLCHIYGGTKADENCKEWLEVNGIKYLFHRKQPWSRQQVQSFVLAAWTYGGFS
jgi:hypothetical protein